MCISEWLYYKQWLRSDCTRRNLGWEPPAIKNASVNWYPLATGGRRGGGVALLYKSALKFSSAELKNSGNTIYPIWAYGLNWALITRQYIWPWCTDPSRLNKMIYQYLCVLDEWSTFLSDYAIDRREVLIVGDLFPFGCRYWQICSMFHGQPESMWP